MRRGGGWLLCGLVVAWSAPGLAQVAPSAAPQATAPGTTELSFFSEEAGLTISVRPDGEEGASWNLVPGIVSGDVQALCETPCRMRVPPGHYAFLAGVHEFEVDALGPAQEWYVEDSNEWMFLGGVTLTGLGAAAAVFGAIFTGLAYAEEPTNEDWLLGGRIGLGIGVPLTVLGAFLWAWSYGSAELL